MKAREDEFCSHGSHESEYCGDCRKESAIKFNKAMNALREIAKKVPHQVDRNEAADMACEFNTIALKAIKEIEG